MSWQTSLLENKRFVIANTKRQHQFQFIFRIKLYSITTDLYTKYTIQSSYLEIETIK